MEGRGTECSATGDAWMCDRDTIQLREYQNPPDNMISVSGEGYSGRQVVPDVYNPQKDPPDIVEHTVNTQTATPSMDSSEKRKHSLSETKLNQPCSFNRRGKCLQHNIVGKKTVVKSQKWVKKKTGYGFVTRQSTIYSCTMGQSSEEPPDVRVKEVSCTSPVMNKRKLEN